MLDRNADRLAALSTDVGPMIVERVPMGKHRDGLWRTYTNCIFANGVLLMPSYQKGETERADKALSVYRRLLPHWRIVRIDASHLIEIGGALHCASLNVSRLTNRLDPLRLRNEEILAEELWTNLFEGRE